jgi:branched-chain amino acid aminotransferase
LRFASRILGILHGLLRLRQWFGNAGEEARPVLDNGFTFGDAVYETLRTYGGRPFGARRHPSPACSLRRAAGLSIPEDDRELESAFCPARAGGNAESYIRLIVSRGMGDISYHFERVGRPRWSWW